MSHGRLMYENIRGIGQGQRKGPVRRYFQSGSIRSHVRLQGHREYPQSYYAVTPYCVQVLHYQLTRTVGRGVYRAMERCRASLREPKSQVRK